MSSPEDDTRSPSSPRLSRKVRPSRRLASQSNKLPQHQNLGPQSRVGRKKLHESEGFGKDLSGKPYHMLRGKWGKLEDCPHGVLLPGKYQKATDGSGNPWICPIRSCRFAFKRISALGKHWKRSHRTCLLNDNNDGTFSSRGEYNPKKKRRTANALVISQDPLDPGEPPMAESRSFRQSQLNMISDSHADASQLLPKANIDGKATPENAMGAESAGLPQDTLVDTKVPAGHAIKNIGPAIMLPTDLTMATAMRAYNEWPDESETLVNTRGALLPPYYKLGTIPGFQWVCPVRSCRRSMRSLSSLSGHFLATHNSTLLNDNRDGTFSVLGRYTEIVTGKRRPPVVKSKDALPKDASPLMEPQAPPPWANARLREDFLAGQALLSSRSLVATGQRHTRTLDESMFMVAPIKIAGGASRSSNLSELSSPISVSDLDISESEAGRQHREPSEQLGAAPVNKENHGEVTARLEAAQSAALQNWELIRKLFTIRQFSPPKAGSLSKLLSQPRRREIALNPSFQVIVEHPKTVSLLIVQLIGDEAPVPCDWCAQGRGPFRGCVAVGEDVAAEIQNGVVSCTNCAYKGRHQGKCNLKELLDQHVSLASAASEMRRVRHFLHDTVASNGKASIVGGLPRSTNPSGEESLLPLAAEKKSQDNNRHDGLSMRKTSYLFPNLASKATTARLTPSQDPEVRLDGLSDAGSAQETGVGTGVISQSTKTDGRFDFCVITIPTETALQLQPDYSHFRLCSLVTGKVIVQLNGEPAFKMGAGGVLKLLQGVSGEVINSFGINAVLHLSRIQ